MESHRNTLLYNYLVAASILILAWATIYASRHQPDVSPTFFDALVLLTLSFAGFLASVGWVVVEWRVSQGFDNLIDLTKDAEKAVPGCSEGSLPYLVTANVQKAKFPRWIRWARMGVFSALVPGGFAVVYAVLFFASWGGNPMEWLNQNSGTVQAIVAVAVAVLTLALVLITRRYADETQKYREIAADTLEHLRVQYAKGYDTCVVPSGWDGSTGIQLLNLGPGSAKIVEVRAAHRISSDRVRYMCARVAGIPADGTVPVNMWEAEPFTHKDFAADSIDENLTVVIVAHSVLGTQMQPRRWHLIPEPLRTLV